MRHILAAAAIAAICTGVTAAQAPNTLTAKEKAEGWILLFDGKSLGGWESHGADWRAENGVLVADSGKPGWLGTTATYGDFILKAEFRTGAKTNSGIYIRAARQGGAPRQTGYEVQIRDFPEPNENPVYLTGSLVRHAQAKGAAIVPDQWNTFEITAQGDHFVVLYNGAKVLDARDSKSASGVIGIEFNNARIEFRNLKLRPLGQR
jgi:hypothetical protein